MSTIDSRVAHVLDSAKAEEDDEALFDALEDDTAALDAFREQRMQQLSSELSRAKDMRNESHGTYTEIKDEKALMDITTSSKLCVVHFFKPDFGRCGIMDGHLEVLAPKHFDTRFLKINVDNAPFLVTKLKVKVLPCVIAFIDGIGVDRLIGFEGVSFAGDSFTTSELEGRLLSSGVLLRSKTTGAETTADRRNLHNNKDEEDDDDDWD
ncbi:thioredoxin-like protein [Xylona heveae TC161]|uniref:Thioredoxin-like protein n=1 Tax=Xylona heveae (strain CBS 132557 / TC161) TaxID=1328760 RepID=A0A165FS12_XYLHT|nr:thioredoxin-like protein [Xylona heveae TC161]KZF21306.1 thioredoxin-like protein [Xylona heveae TC161]